MFASDPPASRFHRWWTARLTGTATTTAAAAQPPSPHCCIAASHPQFPHDDPQGWQSFQKLMLQLIYLNSAYRYLGQVQIAFADILLFLSTNWSQSWETPRRPDPFSYFSIEFQTLFQMSFEKFTRDFLIKMIIGIHDSEVVEGKKNWWC